jgi:hypothetical protein
VFPIVAKVKRWWQPSGSRGQRLALYRVRCACGETASGARRGHFQLVTCGRCGRHLFVLPRSPLPSVADSLIEARKSGIHPASAAARPVSRRRKWLALVAVGLVGAALVGVAFAPRWWDAAGRIPRETEGPSRAAPPDVLLKNARENLAVGNYRLALAGLQELAAAGPNPDAPPRRQWEPLLAQAALLADLSAESLEEILAHAAVGRVDEWEADFPARYRGRAFLFDLELNGPAGGPYRHSWALPAGVRMEFAELRLLRRLPLEEPTRLLFGARLAWVRRDTPTSWEVLFEPDSGVLLTDPGAAAACCPFLGEAELLDLVRRQAGWLP